MKDLWVTFRERALQKRYILLTVVITFIYLYLIINLLNYKFVGTVVFGNFPLLFKLNIIFLLFQGIFTAFSLLDTVLLFITGLLVGINISLFLSTFKNLDGSPVKVVIGGGSLLGIISGGCSSCGFSVLSVLGVGTSISFLPFGIKTLYIFSIGTLLFSIIYMTKKLTHANACKMKKK